MAEKRNKFVFIPIYILLASILVVSIFVTQNQETRTKAATLEEEFRNCITPPKCCYDIVATGDSHACVTPWGVDGDGRGWCPPNMCAAVQGRGDRCGWYWLFREETKGPTGYGCVIGPDEASMKMKFKPDGSLIDYPSSVPPAAPPTEVPRPTETVLPTSPPVPTQEVLPPTSPPLPTQIIKVEPTASGSQIPSVPIRYPTNPPPTLIPTKVPFKVSLPNILPPKEKVDSFFTQIKLNVQDFLSKILP